MPSIFDPEDTEKTLEELRDRLEQKISNGNQDESTKTQKRLDHLQKTFYGIRYVLEHKTRFNPDDGSITYSPSVNSEAIRKSLEEENMLDFVNEDLEGRSKYDTAKQLIGSGLKLLQDMDLLEEVRTEGRYRLNTGNIYDLRVLEEVVHDNNFKSELGYC